MGLSSDSVVCVCGLQWGDEGKGKIVDALADAADFVIRYQGGQNAGHTVHNQYGKHVLNLLPSGVFSPRAVNIIGPYVALDLERLRTELQSLREHNVPEPQLRISNRVRVVLPHHVLFDGWEEERLKGNKFGSTRTGISPFYQQLVGKTGVPLTALLGDVEEATEAVARAMEIPSVVARALYGKELPAVEEVVAQLRTAALPFKDMVVDTVELCFDALKAGKTILCEAQLGAMRDVVTGVYPVTTSSPTLAGFAAAAAGVPPWSITRVIGVAKAYTSKVGTGPLVTAFEAEDSVSGEYIQNFGGMDGERGARTGRLRDVGWPDWVLTRYGARCQGATEIAVTNLDVIGALDEIKVCVAYELDGKRLESFPVPRDLNRVKPVYKSYKGWGLSKEQFGKIRSVEELPENAKLYLRDWESFAGVPIRLLSTGPGRDQLLELARSTR